MRRRRFLNSASLLALLPASALATSSNTGKLKDSLTHLEKRNAAPAFSLDSTNGGKVSLSDFDGKVLVVNFWATWCPPCRQEMPSLQRLWRTLQPDGVELVAIDFGDPPAPVQEFAREANIQFPLLLDPLGETVRAYGVVGLPTTFVVDRQGQVAIKATGERDWDAQRIVDAIRKLAQE